MDVGRCEGSGNKGEVFQRQLLPQFKSRPGSGSSGVVGEWAKERVRIWAAELKE